MTDIFSFLDDPAEQVAPRLLGCILERKVDGHVLRGRITEVEAYDQSDAASHSHRGRTPRTDVMFGPAGYLYVYFTYGMHYCCNVVVGPVGFGAAVLIRAIEPLKGEDIMIKNRGGRAGIDLTNGPAKVCQALAINRDLNGHDLHNSPLRLIPGERLMDEQIGISRRIGISKALDTMWRFYIKSE